MYAVSQVKHYAVFSPMRTFSGENGKNLFWPRKSRESPALTPTFHIHLPETDWAFIRLRSEGIELGLRTANWQTGRVIDYEESLETGVKQKMQKQF